MFHLLVTWVTGLRDKVKSSKGTGDERQDKVVVESGRNVVFYERGDCGFCANLHLTCFLSLVRLVIRSYGLKRSELRLEIYQPVD